MRSFATLTVAGVAGVVLFKVVTAVIFPVLGLLAGLLFLTVKVALIAGVIYFIWSMIRRKMEGEEGEAEHGDDEGDDGDDDEEETIEAEVVED